MYIYICIGVLFCNQVLLIISIQSQNLSLLLSLSLSLYLLSAIVKEQSSLNILSVKVLEGVMHVEDNFDYNFSSPLALREKTAAVHNEGAIEAATPLLPEELSGPR